jgi:hypothetical protein
MQRALQQVRRVGLEARAHRRAEGDALRRALGRAD